MGTIAEKLTYLNGTKQALKTSINNIGGSITNETTFREYAQELDNIYDNLPKVSGEGTSITLTPTLKGKLDFEDDIVGYGDTRQDSTTGTQRADTNELIAETTTNGITYSLKDGIFKLNGTCTKAFNIALTNVVSLESGAYSFGISDVSGAYGGVIGKYMDNSSGTIMLEGGQLRNTANSSLSKSYDNLHARLYIAKDVAANNLSFKLNLVKGTYTSDTMPAWEPYTNGASPNPSYPQNIEVVTGTQEVTISNSDNTETQTQQISLGDIELCKIGTYQDYLYKSNDKWYKKEYIGKVVFTGASSETWNYSVNDAFFYNNDILNLATPTTSFYCNYFESVAPSSVTPVNMRSGTIKFQTNSIATLFLKYTDINTLANFKTWLSTHNTIVYYLLKNSADIEITDTTLIDQLNNLEKAQSYNGVTNISSSGNLSAILSVSALKGE